MTGFVRYAFGTQGATRFLKRRCLWETECDPLPAPVVYRFLGPREEAFYTTGIDAESSQTFQKSEQHCIKFSLPSSLPS